MSVSVQDVKLQLESITTDSEDHLYYNYYQSAKITKCNRAGGNIQKYEVHQDKGSGHFRVAVVRNEVMMCGRFNKGIIMIYDRQLKYVRRIEHAHLGEFVSVSSDIDGNIYVSDKTNNCIDVFSNDGVFLHSIGSEHNGIRRLDGPYSVCVFGQYVYVTNRSGHSVTVFTTAGNYVSSFGKFGKKEGEFNLPCGLCVDRDGFLYVADYHNNRVQCF